MATGTMTSKGQITVPKEVREALGLTPGTKVAFRFEDGRWTLTTEQLRATDEPGVLHSGRKAVSVDDMDDAIAEAILESQPDARSSRMRDIRETAIRMQDAMSVATHAERQLAAGVRSLRESGLDPHGIAAETGLNVEYVERLLDGRRESLKFL